LTRLGRTEVISVIHPASARSQRVAGKLGMTRARQIDNPVLGIKAEVWSLRYDSWSRVRSALPGPEPGGRTARAIIIKSDTVLP
jgi:RimJ/RimL family protein N-acetyltransferase